MKVKSRQNVKHTIKDLNDALVETMIQKGWPLQPDAQLCNATLIVYDNLVSKQWGINFATRAMQRRTIDGRQSVPISAPLPSLL